MILHFPVWHQTRQMFTRLYRKNKIISQEKEFEIPSLRRVSQSEMIKVNDSDLSNIKVCYVNAVLSELSF